MLVAIKTAVLVILLLVAIVFGIVAIGSPEFTPVPFLIFFILVAIFSGPTAGLSGKDKEIKK